MSESLEAALREVRALVNETDQLVKAVASGARRGHRPRWVKAELRPVALKSGVKLQVTRHDAERPFTENLADPGSALDELLAEPFGHWRVETTTQTIQLRVTKRGAALVHRETTDRARDLTHDRTPPHLIAPDDPLFGVLGAGAAKRRQVDAFLRSVAPLLDNTEAPHVVDLGCGNAYLTFATYRYLTGKGTRARVTGVDIREDQRERNTRLAEQLGWSDVEFIAGSIDSAPLERADVVLALHACDTATDDALAHGVRLGAKHIVAAPCCHHDIAAQLRGSTAPQPYTALTLDGALRERFADVLTDSLRASLLRAHGYRVDVIEFTASAHTPRNTMLRVTRTDASPDPARRAEYDELVSQWNVKPHLQALLQ